MGNGDLGPALSFALSVTRWSSMPLDVVSGHPKAPGAVRRTSKARCPQEVARSYYREQAAAHQTLQSVLGRHAVSDRSSPLM
jgi:hypothetical protein